MFQFKKLHINGDHVDLFFYLKISLFLVMLLTILWFRDYLDYTNIINNGFVGEDSITFDTDNKELINFILEQDDSLVFQYTKNESVKHVWLNIDEIKQTLPIISLLDQEINNELIAIKGKDYLGSVPEEYELVAFFNTPSSFQLNTSLWLVQNDNQFSFENGTRFTINSSSQKSLRKTIQELNKYTINPIDLELSGSYNLKSIQLVDVIINISTILILLLIIFSGYNWFGQFKNFVCITYTLGITPSKIFNHLLKTKLFLISLISFSISSFTFLFLDQITMWSTSWFYIFLFFGLGVNLFFFMLSITLIHRWLKNNGGKYQ